MLPTRINFFVLIIVAFSPWILAQQAPTGGVQIQRIPASPIPQTQEPNFPIEPDTAPATAQANQAKLAVNNLLVTGNTVYSSVELVAATHFNGRSELTLGELNAMASRITDYYRSNGYFVAQAYVPAQEIKDGVVAIAVIEGEYAEVTLRNETRISNLLVHNILNGVASGDTVAIAPLERSLLLLSDLPGASVKSTLVPGASPGTSDLIVDVTPGQRITGSIDGDNEGDRYTGEQRVGVTANFNNPTSHGDVVTVRMLTSADGMNYGRGAYQMQFGQARAGVAYAKLNYRLGQQFSSLDVNGTARITSLYGSYPLIRSRSTNLYARLAFDAKTFEDKVDATATITDKKARVGMASLNGEHRDGFGGGGVSSVALTWSHGQIDIRTPVALAIDAATVRTQGNFNKFTFNAQRLQKVSETLSLYGAVNGQFGSKNLDISEKMGLGGAYAVRAYPPGEAYGDQGYVLNLEARALLPQLTRQLPGQMQLVGFVDTGTVTLNKNSFAPGDNRRTLSGAGIGITWNSTNDFLVKAYWAHKLGNEVATSAPDKANRFWIQAAKFF